MIQIIAAISQNWVIWENNKIPWHLPEDLARFRRIITGQDICMGRRTAESIQTKYPDTMWHPLARINYILSRANPTISIAELQERSKNQVLWCIGGWEIYRQMLPIADELWITHIDREIVGDTYFPAIDPSVWKVIQEEVGWDIWTRYVRYSRNIEDNEY
jgi:dihydrofolate reductase